MVPKPFKIRSPSSGRKYGVAARSLKELRSKACVLLQLPVSDCQLYLYEDGTEVTEDYFQHVPDHSELILLPPGESWHGYVSEIQRFLDAFSNRTDDIVLAARGLLSDEEAPKRRKLLADLIQNLSENISAENREDDGKWFEGVESRFKTKSSYMRYSCESRIRGYMKEVGNYASALHPAVQAKFKRIAEVMLERLKLERYNGSYFDRREDEKVCLCTPEGWFSCQGPFDMEHCLCRHSINPYGNKESRVLFSTWNLDHVIEKKRTVLPTLAEAFKDRDGREVNWEYFYQLLFTVENLKLVHIACHKKGNHNLSCDKPKIFRKRKQPCKIRK
ncbi:DNA fragmentation factor subunit beta isoform X2 [Rhineura floridana]|uniref:DNA fragmentation factor subunit beta isoform X2 n=1 Tax=Rhineura floridana TaxID=261503 RepID=UPI002AC84627|nr:DNA fragmentation factor subunit beta isoform X2 [Rhineura floridana]